MSTQAVHKQLTVLNLFSLDPLVTTERPVWLRTGGREQLLYSHLTILVHSNVLGRQGCWKRRALTMAGVWSHFVIFLVKIVSSSSRTSLSATSSCYYQPYYKQLTCKCGPVDRVTSLSLRLEYFVQGAGNQVRECLLYNT